MVLANWAKGTKVSIVDTRIRRTASKNQLKILEKLTDPDKEQGKAIVRTDLQLFLSFLKGEPKDVETWKRYKRAYEHIPIVAAAIDVSVDNAVQNFYITGRKDIAKKSKKKLEEPEENTSDDIYKEEIKKLISKFNLVEFFYNVAKQMLIYGNSFVEIVKTDEEGIVDLKILDPLTMYVNRNEKGNFSENQEDAYLQYLEGKPMNPINFKYDEIVHFKWNPVGENAYGNSIIAPLIAVLQIKINTEANLDVMIDKFASPLRHFKIGTPDRPASQGEIDAFNSDLQGIQADTELVTDDRVAAEILETKQGAQTNLGPALEYIENQVVAGLQTPLVFLGRGNTDRAAAETQLDMFDRKAKVLQRVIKRTAEMQIFKVHLELIFGEIENEEIPELTWGDPQQRQSREDIEQIINLKSAGVISAQKANDLLPEEFREALPQELKNPMSGNGLGLGKPQQAVGKSEPSLDRIQKGRDKRGSDARN